MSKPTYDYVSSMQEAINKAVAERRVVRFLSNKATPDLKREIIDLKGCKMRKPDMLSPDIAVIPPCIDPDTFDFDEVDTRIIL
jgi:hypothetical protein